MEIFNSVTNMSQWSSSFKVSNTLMYEFQLVKFMFLLYLLTVSTWVRFVLIFSLVIYITLTSFFFKVSTIYILFYVIYFTFIYFLLKISILHITSTLLYIFILLCSIWSSLILSFSCSSFLVWLSTTLLWYWHFWHINSNGFSLLFSWH